MDYFSGAFGIVMAAVFGLVFGSALNCAAMRYIRGEDWVRGRSRCRDCGHELGARDLVPLLSFLLSGGKCRYCGAKISVRYPLTEMAFCVVTVLLFLRFGFSVLFVRHFLLSVSLFVLTLTDIEDRVIPNWTIALALFSYFATEVFLHKSMWDLVSHVLSMFVYAGAICLLSVLMDRILGKESMGGGDIKLIGVMALYLGPFGSMFMLLLACVMGLLFAAASRLGRGEAIAFGPFLALAGFVMALYGEPIVSWYEGFL